MAGKKKNRIAISAIASVFFMVAGVISLTGCNKEDGYRMIQVHQVEGKAEIDRKDVGTMEAYENLNLVSGDSVAVAEDSFVRLKLDEDKYALMEEDTVAHINATGTEENSKTDIQLEKGAITIEVQNKLEKDSTFEVSTPNAVMAVRGTVFGGELDENGDLIVHVYEGTVDVNGENVSAGKTVIITKDKEIIWGDIEIGELKLEVLKFLLDIAENREICFTKEELEHKVKEMGETTKPSDDAKGNKKDDSADSEADEENSSADSDDKKAESAAADADGTKQEGETTDGGKTENGSTNSGETKKENGSTGSDETKKENGSTGSGGTKKENGSTGSDETKKENGSIGSGGTEKGNAGGNKTEGAADSGKQPGVSNTPASQTYYTVRFMWKKDGNDTVFAEQKVKKGGKAAVPQLLPTFDGTWDFDFNKAITQDTEIWYVE